MISRFINAIKHVHHPMGFEAYYIKLQRAGVEGAPSVEEAKKDYQSLLNITTAWGR